jgi:hypothetical protein
VNNLSSAVVEGKSFERTLAHNPDQVLNMAGFAAQLVVWWLLVLAFMSITFLLLEEECLIKNKCKELGTL